MAGPRRYYYLRQYLTNRLEKGRDSACARGRGGGGCSFRDLHSHFDRTPAEKVALHDNGPSLS